jgi:Mrp family chromosome partitioning ATPase
LPLFLSDHFRQTLTEIRQNFDYIFIDTPAILEHAEAVAIGALCDAQVVVARQECRPSLAEMETAVRKISHQDSVFLGVIMNGFVL